MKELKFGIIGTGMISGMFAEAVREVKGVSVSIVLSRKRETGEDFVRRIYTDGSSRPNVVTGIKELFSSEVNAIYVASPNRYHAETAIEAMRSGFDVLCEKPIASNLKEYDEMLSVSEKTGKVLFSICITPRKLHNFVYNNILMLNRLTTNPIFGIMSRI